MAAAPILGLLLGPGVVLVLSDGNAVREGVADAGEERLCAMCALTRWPAASAAHSESSPAKTAAPMIRAS